MLISNKVIEKLIEEKKIKISNFDPARLGLIEYHLRPYSIHFVKQNEDTGAIESEGDLALTDKPPYSTYSIGPREYVNVTVEKIELSDGIFAQFYLASALIEHGVVLNCGWLRPRYNKAIRLGLFNSSGFEFELKFNTEIARVVFFQLPPDMPIDNEKYNPDPVYAKEIEQLRVTESEIEKTKERLKELEAIKKNLVKY